MTDQDARTEYEQLAALLDRENLSWLKEQVEAYFRFGKPQRREVAVVDEEAEQQDLFGEPAHRRRRGPRVNFLATVKYTPQERLQGLAMAISQAVPQLLEMTNDIPGLLRLDRGGETPQIVLVRELETGELEEKRLPNGVPAEKLAKLRALLHQAAEEASE